MPYGLSALGVAETGNILAKFSPTPEAVTNG